MSWWDVALDYCKLDVPARAGHTCSLAPLFTPQSGPTGLLDLHVCDDYTLHTLQRLRNTGLVDKPLIMQFDPQQQDPTPTSQRHSLSRLFLRT